MKIRPVEVRSAVDLNAAFAVVTNARPAALVTLPDGLLLANKAGIIEFAATSRLPSIHPDREFAEALGLIA